MVDLETILLAIYDNYLEKQLFQGHYHILSTIWFKVNHMAQGPPRDQAGLFYCPDTAGCTVVFLSVYNLLPTRCV